jgi:hypothetical protein
MLTWVPVLKIGRDAVTGRFISVAEARSHPRSTVVEMIRYRPRPVGVRNAAVKRRRRPHSTW